jgi:hypothetical protein
MLTAACPMVFRLPNPGQRSSVGLPIALLGGRPLAHRRFSSAAPSSTIPIRRGFSYVVISDGPSRATDR